MGIEPALRGAPQAAQPQQGAGRKTAQQADGRNGADGGHLTDGPAARELCSFRQK